MRSQTAILCSSTHMQSHTHDAFLKIYRREYKRRFAWIRAGKISQEAFSAWSREAQKEKETRETGKISQKELTQWRKQYGDIVENIIYFSQELKSCII